jgi:predicted GIY-YIG superfamily endonuclease
MRQLLLIPDPRPLDERLGVTFFREAPKGPGVYLMRDAADRVLYVGKAKNLQQRLRNYRIANPDRMPRRHLRMLREVARIEFELCAGEEAALERESCLLRSLKPRYNRAGVWPGKTRFFVWRRADPRLELAVTEAPETGWESCGPMGAGAWHLLWTLAGLLWLALNPVRTAAEFPSGWAGGKIAGAVMIHCGDEAGEISGALGAFFGESPEGFTRLLETRFAARTHLFDRAVIDAGLQSLVEFSARHRQTARNHHNLPSPGS